MRRHLCGFPSRVASDNAIFTSNSRSAAFLKECGVSLIHGHAYVSRCQSKAEKTIGTISRLITKYHTERPSTPFPRLLEEATLTYNSSPSDALPHGYAPRDLHFVRAPVSFLQTAADDVIDGVPRSLIDAVRAARISGRQALQHDVAAFLRRQQLRSPTNYSLRLRVGDLVLKKRSVWPAGTPKKLGYRIVIDAFRVTARVATNSFKCTSLIDGGEYVLPGDVLVRVRNQTEDSLRELVQRMEEAAERNTTGPTGVVTRSRAAARAETGDLVASNFARRSLFYLDDRKDSESVDTDISSLF